MINENLALAIFNKIKSDSVETQAFGINIITDTLFETEHIATASDAYVLAEELANGPLPNLWDHMCIVTHGWAAPFSDSDVAPSKHPEKKRVSVYVFVSSDQSMSTVLSMQDEEPMYDTTGTGNMSDAVKAIYLKRNIKNNTLYLGLQHESDEDLFS
jgi:hypothetical protein